MFRLGFFLFLMMMIMMRTSKQPRIGDDHLDLDKCGYEIRKLMLIQISRPHG